MGGRLLRGAEHGSRRSVNSAHRSVILFRVLEALLPSTALQHNLQKTAKKHHLAPKCVFHSSLVFNKSHLTRCRGVFWIIHIKCCKYWASSLFQCEWTVLILCSFTHCTALQSQMCWNKNLYISMILPGWLFFSRLPLKCIQCKPSRAVSLLEIISSLQ